MSVRLKTPPYCEYNCPYLCPLCTHNLNEDTATIDTSDAGVDMINMYPTESRRVIPTFVMSFTDEKLKHIKINEILFISPLATLPPLKIKEGEIVTYPT